jgi:hypothetical protein
MAEKDTGGPDEKSLELPSLFGRKKRGKAEPAPAAPDTSDETTVIEPVTEPAPRAEAAPVVDEPTRTLPATPEPAATRAPEPTVTTPTPQPTPQPEPAPVAGTRKAKPERQRPSLPQLGSAVAALVVGAVVGLLGVVLTVGALQTCDAITGTDSCGGPGLLVVLVVVVVMVMVGTALLRAFGVNEPGGLSFLGVAIFVAVCLVFLIEQLLEPWMIVVGPVLCALGYGTAHWVVNRFNTELLADEQPEPHDVR